MKIASLPLSNLGATNDLRRRSCGEIDRILSHEKKFVGRKGRNPRLRPTRVGPLGSTTRWADGKHPARHNSGECHREGPRLWNGSQIRPTPIGHAEMRHPYAIVGVIDCLVAVSIGTQIGQGTDRVAQMI